MDMNQIRQANKSDEQALIAFLEKAQIGTQGISESIEFFLLIEDVDGNIKGTMGIEPLYPCGLLRSLVVSPEVGQDGLLTLFQQMLKLAKNKELSTLFLATNKMTSVSFFQSLGFSLVDKKDLPEQIGQSTHGNQLLTNESSLFLKLTL
ncbi:GNAT family N-acetyltransferase [Falsibacillus albus]|uniref:N-acetyltransferase domain-containing protein n=1 Tax=Falsibacillus albus TaxID=2478915 RepID=A0A3L7JSN4_9BACI|nr:hypothetical protein [Falsibacillus albus]RLQ93500.1 hypothetical protein D9X91_17530 [Falsibacillus albus]